MAALLGAWFLGCGDGGGTVTPDPPEPPNRAPEAVGSVPAQVLVEGDTATLDVASSFRDPDGDSLTYAAATSDAGVATASVSGTLVTIRAVAAGMTTVTVTARDPGGLTATQPVSVSVDPANRAPLGVGAIAGREMGVGQYAAIDVSSYFTDPDGDSLVYGAESSDAAVALASVAGEIIVVSGVAPGSVTVTVTARDPGGLEATQTVGAEIEEGGNRTPQVSRIIPDQTSHVAVATGVDLASYFWDPDGDALTYLGQAGARGRRENRRGGGRADHFGARSGNRHHPGDLDGSGQPHVDAGVFGDGDAQSSSHGRHDSLRHAGGGRYGDRGSLRLLRRSGQ